jgi:purine-cytosine permease-like protein
MNNNHSVLKSTLFSIFGAFVGFLIGKLSKSPEIILIGIPLGALIGYKFTNYLAKFFSFILSLLKKYIPKIFKQV